MKAWLELMISPMTSSGGGGRWGSHVFDGPCDGELGGDFPQKFKCKFGIKKSERKVNK
jgi:hypothetical protein